jgi:hypothetical protein
MLMCVAAAPRRLHDESLKALAWERVVNRIVDGDVQQDVHPERDVDVVS